MFRALALCWSSLLETSAKHHIPRATNIPYQPLLIKLIFSVLAHTVFFKTNLPLFMITLALDHLNFQCTIKAGGDASFSFIKNWRYFYFIRVTGPYLARGRGREQLPPQRFDKVTITLLQVSSLPPPSNKRKWVVPENIHTPTTGGIEILPPHAFGNSKMLYPPCIRNSRLLYPPLFRNSRGVFDPFRISYSIY